MRRINLYIQKESFIPNAARMVGVPESEIRDKFQRAQELDVACIFSTYVTEAQWEAMQEQKNRLRRTDNGG